MADNAPALKPRVLVLYGGQSSEHSVSCVTAAGVLGAIDTDAFDVVAVGITATGQWTRPVIDPRTHAFGADELPRVLPTESTVQLHSGAAGSSERSAELLEVHPDGSSTAMGQVDVVFRCCTGPSVRTAPCRVCLSSPACPMSAPVCSARRWPWTSTT